MGACIAEPSGQSAFYALKTRHALKKLPETPSTRLETPYNSKRAWRQVVEMSQDHKPNDPKERTRIEAANGSSRARGSVHSTINSQSRVHHKNAHGTMSTPKETPP